MIDLNSLLAAGSGWYLEFANAINDNGQIMGFGLHNGIPTDFEWTLPSSLSAAQVSLVGVSALPSHA